MKVADFFCGAGGFSEGFRQAGFNVIYAVDKWEPAVITHKANYPQCFTDNIDIIELSNLPDDEFHERVPDTEIIIGSPPCVAFSSSNKSGKGNKEEGIKLIKAYLKIIARKKYKEGSILKYWLLENVPNVKKYIQESYTAKELGINNQNFILNVCGNNTGVYRVIDYGAPTKRKRFICGEFPKPIEENKKTEQLNLRYILESLGNPLACNESIITDPNWKFSMKKSKVSDMSYICEVAEFEWKKAKRLKEDKGYMGRMSFPENLDKPARTIMATMSCSSRESFVLGYGEDRYRLPTVREVATIMSFPLEYKFYGKSKGIKYKLVGNAVPPKFSYALAKAIALEEKQSIPYKYIHVKHDKKIPFVNLNGKKFDLNVEKRKKMTAKFKYHIPYMILSSFRVELTNRESDFKRGKYLWTTEIHKSQGINAKVYILEDSDIQIPDYINDKVNFFVNEIAGKIKTHTNLQQYFCLTEIERKNNILGPIEVLESVKRFLEKENSIEIGISTCKEQIPSKIILGYYILKKILNKVEG